MASHIVISTGTGFDFTQVGSVSTTGVASWMVTLLNDSAAIVKSSNAQMGCFPAIDPATGNVYICGATTTGGSYKWWLWQISKAGVVTLSTFNSSSTLGTPQACVWDASSGQVFCLGAGVVFVVSPPGTLVTTYGTLAAPLFDNNSATGKYGSSINQAYFGYMPNQTTGNGGAMIFGQQSATQSGTFLLWDQSVNTSPFNPSITLFNNTFTPIQGPYNLKTLFSALTANTRGAIIWDNVNQIFYMFYGTTGTLYKWTNPFGGSPSISSLLIPSTTSGSDPVLLWDQVNGYIYIVLGARTGNVISKVSTASFTLISQSGSTPTSGAISPNFCMDPGDGNIWGYDSSLFPPGGGPARNGGFAKYSVSSYSILADFPYNTAAPSPAGLFTQGAGSELGMLGWSDSVNQPNVWISQ
jgi:hypothetical protein